MSSVTSVLSKREMSGSDTSTVTPMTARVDGKSPLVSVGLPVYNGENFVREAIQCLLDQTFSGWELVICDNCSTDNSVAICEEFAKCDRRIRVFRNPRNMGVSYNYNEVFRRARGKYFKWMSHDDLFAPEFIEECVQELETDDSLVLVFPKMCHVDGHGHVIRGQASELSVMGMTQESRGIQLMALAARSMDFIWLAYGLIRTDVVRECGALGLHAGDDQVLLFKVALRGRIKQIEREMFYRREHAEASTCKRGESTVRQRAKFAYADDNRRLVLPWCRLLKEHVICVWNIRRPLTSRMRCLRAVLRRFLAAWKFFVEEAFHSPVDALRTR